ncbi:hypothetical protein OOZ19_18485 [Saccharopolyspora sp. NFXS83]|uniref:hypothetical protein n=1 Tax=Saccharopolyspora sp. NFXS83 TaxID=2993560 RepID=UPI00224A9225|nr:hypothetical protein [Saccharopolyspora sp. NFXS83]MCX2732230.1 hypothetical protein [Saccharopolyspora sp. NFXS83]
MLTPRWLLMHAVFVAAVIATAFLAWWQWDRAHEAGGSFQNLGYALQWPLFGVFTLCMWVWLIRMELQQQGPPETVSGNSESADPAETEGDGAKSRRRPLVPPPAPPVEVSEDPELAEYNRYLAELNDADQRAG